MCMFFDPFSFVMGSETSCISREAIRASTANRPMPMLVWETNTARQDHQQEGRANQGSASSLVAGASKPQARQVRRGAS
jgi:hypothetical protein